MRAQYWVSVGLLAGGVLTIGASVQSQGVDPLPALLAEVHALRLTMEQQGSVGPRIQLTMARLNIQEQRVTHLTSDLNSVRMRLAEMENGSKGFNERVAESERMLQVETDPTKRRQLEGEQREMQRVLRLQEGEQQQLRARESEAAQSLATEQARWADLNGRLDELERLLTPVR